MVLEREENDASMNVDGTIISDDNPAGRHRWIPTVVMVAIGWSLCSMAWGVDAPAPRNFAPYQVILDRMPFGRAPAVSEVAIPGVPVPVADPAQSFARALRLVALTETDTGLRVGLVDIEKKPPKSYFLYIGQAEDGIEIVDAEYEGERAKLRKGSEELWISMGSGATVAGGGPTTLTSLPGPGPGLPLPGSRGGFRPATPSTGPAAAVSGLPTRPTERVSGRRASYAERLKHRREQQEAERKRLSEEATLTGEALETHLNKLQMDLIRKGEPPLPIPLTPEMDDQLVAEGVLPAVEEGTGSGEDVK